LTLKNGEVLVVRPIEWLEEEYPSFVVEILENSGLYEQGNLFEAIESEVKEIESV